MIVQRKDDSDPSAVRECNQMQRLYRKADEAEKKERQAVIVGDVAMVK